MFCRSSPAAEPGKIWQKQVLPGGSKIKRCPLLGARCADTTVGCADCATMALHVSQHDTADLLASHKQGLSVIFASSQHLVGLTCTQMHQVSSAWLTRLLMVKILRLFVGQLVQVSAVCRYISDSACKLIMPEDLDIHVGVDMKHSGRGFS